MGLRIGKSNSNNTLYRFGITYAHFQSTDYYESGDSMYSGTTKSGTISYNITPSIGLGKGFELERVLGFKNSRFTFGSDISVSFVFPRKNYWIDENYYNGNFDSRIERYVDNNRGETIFLLAPFLGVYYNKRKLLVEKFFLK